MIDLLGLVCQQNKGHRLKYHKDADTSKYACDIYGQMVEIVNKFWTNATFSRYDKRGTLNTCNLHINKLLIGCLLLNFPFENISLI